MCNFFYATRNIIGLLLILTPTFGFLFNALSHSMEVPLLISLVLGISFGRACYNCLPFKFWLSFACIAVNYSAFTLIYWGGTPIAHIGCLLLGICAGALIFILPANIVVGWFFISKTAVLGRLLSGAVVMGFLFTVLLANNLPMALILSLPAMVGSSLFLLEKPILLNFGDRFEESVHSKKSRRKIALFFLLISLSSAVVFRLGYLDILPDFGSPDTLFVPTGKAFLVNAGFAAGPVITSYFADKKGIFPSCILLIFLVELSIVGAGFYSNGNSTAFLSHFAFGAALSSGLVLCPLLIYYLLGPASYNQNLGKTALFMPLGICLLFPLEAIDHVDFVSAPFLFSAFFLLIVSFFSVFSAWKRRLVLLKNS